MGKLTKMDLSKLFYGIKCDNTECDYLDLSVKFEEYPNWIDKPCPKCGTNLLTQSQYDEANCAVFQGEMASEILGVDFDNLLTQELLKEGISEEDLKSIHIPQRDIDEVNDILKHLGN